MRDSILDDLFGPGAHDTILGSERVLTWYGAECPHATNDLPVLPGYEDALRQLRESAINKPATHVLYRPADLEAAGASEDTIRQLMGWDQPKGEK